MSNANPVVNERMSIYMIGSRVICAKCGCVCKIGLIDHIKKMRCANQKCYKHDRPGQISRTELDKFDLSPPLKAVNG